MTQIPASNRSSYGLALPLFRISASQQGVFPDLVEILLERSFALEVRERAVQEKTQIARRKTCVLFLDGLYQAFCSHVPHTAVAFPHSQRFYKRGQHKKISSYSYRNVHACYLALVDLGWVTYCRGFVDADGQNHPTTVAPAGDLLERFRSAKPVWQRLAYTGDAIIVRLKEGSTGIQDELEPPDTAEVRLMRDQLDRINEFLGDQAICLSLPNKELKALALRMASQRYSYELGEGRRRTRARVLNFAQVSLRRIFAKGRMDRGGRLYGGWWQTIPKESRRFITINGRPTVEIDFSEMHPTMLYVLAGQPPPDNIYDLGIRKPKDPPYDPKVEPHKSRRKIIKTFLNALINDERRKHRLDARAAKMLGLTHEELEQLVLEKHPIIGKALGTDTGLYLQYLDSEIACRVMLRLLEQNIVALPVHDSFLVQADLEPELVAAMRQAFAAEMNAQAQLKDAEMPQDAFEPLGTGRSLEHLIKAHRQSFHHLYVQSWRQQHPEPAHPNLSYFPPYRFPDGELATPAAQG